MTFNYEAGVIIDVTTKSLVIDWAGAGFARSNRGSLSWSLYELNWSGIRDKREFTTTSVFRQHFARLLWEGTRRPTI